MNVILFGATGMVGQGVLRECLLDPQVKTVVSVVRAATGQKHQKLRELVHADFMDYSGITTELSDLDACFYVLEVSAAGMTEEDYGGITFGFTITAAEALAARNHALTFLYVSGKDTDSTEHGRVMWARVKGRTENALLRLPFKAAYMFRPGIIQPLHGIKSKTKSYRILYDLMGPLMPTLRSIFPKSITTTEQLGRAMLKVAKSGYPKSVLESVDIAAI
jgi:uncharacterized protein YbjT (DUF2867 family)